MSLRFSYYHNDDGSTTVRRYQHQVGIYMPPFTSGDGMWSISGAYVNGAIREQFTVYSNTRQGAINAARRRIRDRSEPMATTPPNDIAILTGTSITIHNNTDEPLRWIVCKRTGRAETEVTIYVPDSASAQMIEVST